MKLVIVESPAKARTISRFLDESVNVEASMGHVRDLAASGLSVDVEAGFVPTYVVTEGKQGVITKLKSALKKADELYLATDEDREGESIAWHLTEVLQPKVAVRRMVFHEITEEAIRAAFNSPRDIDRKLVDAQEARRILDRLYGYGVSPVLWRRIRPNLSAGRVQSVAVRILVERERERIDFVSAGYWDLLAELAPPGSIHFEASLVQLDGARVATGADFDSTGRLTTAGARVLDETEARRLAADLVAADFRVRQVETKPYRRGPYPPFRTSTLQQEAARKLRFSASRTMSVAQRLYEGGYITYMRTDSTALSESALAAARSQIVSLFGPEYLPDRPRTYTNKVKNAQEAHEAIRPTGDKFRTPEQVRRELNEDEARVYELVWKRTVASQMKDALGESIAVRVGAVSADGTDAEFAASGRTITFPGFLRAYVEGSDDPEAALDDQETPLPPLTEGERLDLHSLEPIGHATKPPPRFTEASLVKRLEELGVGRPSTYASIISTIKERGYVFAKGQALIPTFTAFSVVNLLERHFDHLVDYTFTARMEDDLDAIAEGEEQVVPWLSRFYLGPEGLAQQIETRLEEIDAREVNSFSLGLDRHSQEVVIRVGRYGPFVQRDTQTASVPDKMPPDELTLEKAIELLEEQPAGEKILGTDPESGQVVIARTGRFGPYVQLGESGEGLKPKTATLLKSQSLDSLTLEEALQLLTLPRTVGVDPATGTEIKALNGRFGPYLERGTERRSLSSEEELFTVTLGEALALFAKPPARRAGARALRELGNTPEGKPVSLRSGRYGPYVTDGDLNASLRAADDPETISLERALELLGQRRERLADTTTEVRRSRRSGTKASGSKKTGGKGRSAQGATGSAAPAKRGSKKRAGAARSKKEA